jgi:hypothetical protein
MENQNRLKPTALSSIIVSSIVVLDILSTLLVGFILYALIEMSDPVVDISFDLEAFYKQKDHDQLTLGLIIFTFIIVFVIALILWIKGKCFWDFIISGLTLMHLVGINYLVASIYGFQLIIFIPSLILDFAILAVIFLDRKHSKSLANIGTA